MAPSRIKIRLYGVHLAYVSQELLEAFDKYCPQANFSGWIKEKIYMDFGVLIGHPDQLENLDEMVKELYYDNVAEGIREKMRTDILNSEGYKEEQRGF